MWRAKQIAQSNQCSLENNCMQDDQDVVREFLVESHENLSRLDQALIELELRPRDAALLASIFRTIHTIKGTCGFFAFSTLERITHQAETLLSQLRDGKRELTPSLVSLILETVDATRKVLASIEASGKEGADLYEDLTERLRVEAQCLDGNESRSNLHELPDTAVGLHDELARIIRTVQKPMRTAPDLPPSRMQISGSTSGCWTS